ncbi:M28 family peptidase [Pontimicrobium aquaticum]|uniref:M28 family peptidase n=1 Tax=Pontimicrobium aquaticum TaxID=2565367 RepID=A0A4U0EZK3_9FLAO|nr:M28 family peptidase [Pontimicrobium aquaticum]TJY35812.1 M28 family peptidase [Pontimicrobium aquaticum]
MKKTLILLSISLIAFSCKKEATQEDIINYASTITQDELKDHLYIYASDEFEGRETGEPGQKKAVEYIKKEYETLGIPSVIEGNYFQTVPLNVVKTPNVSISVNGESFNYFEDFISQTAAATGTLSASEIVYAGFGIDDEKYSDYENLDVKGKVVVVKGGEPKDKAGNNILSGGKEASKWSNGRQALSSKRTAAKENGAKAIFFMDAELFNRYSTFYKEREASGGSNRLSLPVKEGADPEIYDFLISEKMGKALVSNINETTETASVPTKLDINYESITESRPSENVAAMITGSEKPDEYIVISSHLDHIGINSKGEINNGADDDGSGTVSLLEIAEAFKTAADKGHGPKRSVIFLHVTGEEKGLLGSRYYTDYEPLKPLANTVANLNIDMVGRIDPKREGDRNYIYLIGADKLSTELHEISEEVNKTFTNIELDYTYNDENDPNRFYYRSDHYNFAKNNIPIIFYFNGTHDDYHRHTDTPDKINYDLLENRSRLVFHTAWELANRAERIVVDKTTEE